MGSQLEKLFECDCGYPVSAIADVDMVAKAQAHARDAHGLELTPDLILVMTGPAEPNRE
jgi:predicted small metal-binding protein